MTAKRKRLKKLMQSIGVQRNDFEKRLKNMREYDGFDFNDIINWVRYKHDFDNSILCFDISKGKDYSCMNYVKYQNGKIVEIIPYYSGIGHNRI